MKLPVRAPDQVIGTPSNPYMLRWWIYRSKHDWMPRIYLHKFLRSDDDRAPHNHPWWFVSILIKGRYLEHRPGRNVTVRNAPSIAFRPITTRHRVELIDGEPAVTLFLSGPDTQSWGFFCGERWIPWREFSGCGE